MGSPTPGGPPIEKWLPSPAWTAPRVARKNARSGPKIVSQLWNEEPKSEY